VFGGILAVYVCLAPLEGKVGEKLEHGGARRNQLGTVHPNLITALRTQESGRRGAEGHEQQSSRQYHGVSDSLFHVTAEMMRTV
jgi:hypothetical protein